jgi:hypothetical protein
MFKITRPQLARFQEAALSTFEEAMVARGAELAPTLAASLGDDQMLVVVRAAIAQAARYGLTFKGPVGLFVELTFLFGSGFDTDAQHPWARACLESASGHGQLQRASALHAASLEALRRIHGPSNLHTDPALRRLSALGQL